MRWHACRKLGNNAQFVIGVVNDFFGSCGGFHGSTVQSHCKCGFVPNVRRGNHSKSAFPRETGDADRKLASEDKETTGCIQKDRKK